MSSFYLWKSKIVKISRFLLVFVLVSAWIFSSFPRIWQNPSIPPKIEEAQAAVSYIGVSNLIATDGDAPGAITPNASTQDGDLLVFYHYSRAAGGNETVALSSFNFVFNSVTAGYGLVAVGWRIKQSGDSTFTATITNHDGSTETVLEWIETYRGFNASNPIVNYTAALSTWASSLNIGSIAAPATATVHDGDMAVVFGGRFENVLTQTVLSGDSLTWAARTRNNTNLGSDAGAVTQNGLNSSGSNQTVTAKTITTTGTTQVGAGRMFIIERATTTLTNFVTAEPSNSTIAPGASGQVDSFGLQTDGSTNDTVTGATITLAAGTGTRISTVAITNDGDTVTYCSAAPSGDTATLTSCGIPVSTTNTQFKIKITAVSHASMPVPPGAEYSVTGTITAFTCTNNQSGSDSGSATVIIDNASPSGATSTSGSAGNAQVTLNWTTSNSSDFSRSVVLRWAALSAGSEVPAEGTDYSVDQTITTATVACVRTSDSSSTPVSGTDGAGTGGCSAVALTNDQPYSYKVFQKDSNGNYDAGVTFSGSPFTTLFSTAIEIKAQDYTTTISTITFPEAVSGATVSLPTNGVGAEVQTFGAAGTAKPVVTLVNTAAVAYNIWYNITAFSNSVVSSENYVIIAKGGACANAGAITETTTLDGANHVCTGTITTIAAAGDPGNADKRDLYLKIVLSASAGKTGTSTLTILGEAL